MEPVSASATLGNSVVSMAQAQDKNQRKRMNKMAKYKLLQVENKVTFRGFLLLPMTWEAGGMDETNIGERLSEDTFEDQESEVWDEWTVDLPDGVEAPEWGTVNFDDYKQYRVKE